MSAWLTPVVETSATRFLLRRAFYVSRMFTPTSVASHLHHVGQALDGQVELPHDAQEREHETRRLLERVAACPDQQARDQLLEEVVLLNLEVAEAVVMRYRNRGVSLDDLVQVACLGLVKAARGFDPDKSDKFLGYAVPTMLGEVKRFFRDSAWTVRPPRRIQELQASISACTSDLTHQLGRAPTPSELAEALDTDTEEVSRALEADGCFAARSLDRPVMSADGGGLAETLGHDEPGFERIEAVAALQPLCKDLTERDRRIVYLRFFHEWTQARIAEECGVTQMQVSRLLTRILAQMREGLGSSDEPDNTARKALAS